MRTLQEALVCIINSSKGRDYLRKRDMPMALVGGPLGQAYFLEFLCLLSTSHGAWADLGMCPAHLSSWLKLPITCLKLPGMCLP